MVALNVAGPGNRFPVVWRLRSLLVEAMVAGRLKIRDQWPNPFDREI
jgi:hypothetical protein